MKKTINLCNKLEKLKKVVVSSPKLTPKKFLTVMTEITNISQELQAVLNQDITQITKKIHDIGVKKTPTVD